MLSVPSARLVFRWKLSKYTQWMSSACTVSFDYSSLKPWETEQEVSTFQEKKPEIQSWFLQVILASQCQSSPNTRSCFFILLCFYWGRFDLQYCIRFRYTVKWLGYICVCIYVCTYVYLIYICLDYIYILKLFFLQVIKNIEYSSLWYKIGPYWLCIL